VSSKLAALFKETASKDALLDFVVLQVVERANSINAKRPAWKKQRPGSKASRTTAARQDEPKAQSVQKLRIALADEIPFCAGPIECPLHAAPMPSPWLTPSPWFPAEDIPPPPMNPAPTQLQKALLDIKGAGGAEAHKVRLTGVPQDWDFGHLTNAFKCAGLCMHCDVGLVQLEAEGQYVINLTSEVAARKVSDLNGMLVDHGGAKHLPLVVEPVEDDEKPVAMEIKPDSILTTLKKAASGTKTMPPSTLVVSSGEGQCTKTGSIYTVGEQFLMKALEPEVNKADDDLRLPWADYEPNEEDLLQALLK